MIQLVTLDRWAAHIVRPLFTLRWDAAFFIICFVFVTTYGLLSIAVGVLVWSTVELARLHDSHRDRVALVQDRERIKNLRDYFHKCLLLEDRDFLDLREIREGMMVAQVKKAYDELDLPVTDLNQLWAHLDEHCEGEITLEQFEHGCQVLLEPAKRFDMACLSAKLAGRGVFADNLGKRCDGTVREMDKLFKRLSWGMAKCRQHAMSDEIKEVFPEVGLRRAGRMHIPRPDDD